MPTRRGPGRPRNPWRPRKLEEMCVAICQDFDKPGTLKRRLDALRAFGDFLRERGVDTEAITSADFIAWIAELRKDSFTKYDAFFAHLVRGFFKRLAGTYPDSRWLKVWSEVKAFSLPAPVGATKPHEPYALALLPKILEASRHVVKRATGGANPAEYSEAHVLTATLLYSAGRAQWYGLRDAEVESALDKKFIEPFVKEGVQVRIPVPDPLLAIWARHLEERDFQGPQFFRFGRNPYTYQDGNRVWQEDATAQATNDTNVSTILRGEPSNPRGPDAVEKQLRLLYDVEERLTAHRFRVSVGTYMEYYGFTEAERRLQLSHGAKTITAHYSRPQILDLQAKLSKMDLGNAEWIAAHDPPTNLFAIDNGEAATIQDLRRQLAAAEDRAQKAEERAERTERKIDELLAKLEPRVVA